MYGPSAGIIGKDRVFLIICKVISYTCMNIFVEAFLIPPLNFQDVEEDFRVATRATSKFPAFSVQFRNISSTYL